MKIIKLPFGVTMKLYKVFEAKLSEYERDEGVYGVLVTGSLARGTETPYSDLDIILLANENKVIEEVIDGVPVESHYRTYEGIMEELNGKPYCLYLYAYSKIVKDGNGELRKLQNIALNRLANYKIADEQKQELCHVMSCLKEKLVAALALNNGLKTDYLVHNNFKGIVEYVYSVNGLPVPPQGLLYEIYDELPVKPSDKWIEKLITLKGSELGRYILDNFNKLCKEG